MRFWNCFDSVVFLFFFILFLDIVDLENKLKSAVVGGQPRKNKAWKKILIVVEGVYRQDIDTYLNDQSINSTWLLG